MLFITAIGSNKYVPLFLVFLSGLGFSIQSIILKFLAEFGLPGVLLTAFCRGFIQLIISLFCIWYTRAENRDTPLFGATTYIQALLVMRSFFGFVSTIGGFMAVETLPVGDGTVLIMLNTILCGVLGVFILNETWKGTQIFATVTSFIGAMLVCRPSFLMHFLDSVGLISSHTTVASANPLGVFYGLFAAVFSSVAYIIIRILGTSAKMPWPNVILAQALGQIVLPIPILAFIAHATLHKIITEVSGYQLFLVCIAGFIGSWSQIAMTIGMQREKSATATAMRTSDIVFGFIWQGIFTSDAILPMSVIGAVLVMSSIVLVVAFKSTESVQINDKYSNVPTSSRAECDSITTSNNQVEPQRMWQATQSLLLQARQWIGKQRGRQSRIMSSIPMSLPRVRHDSKELELQSRRGNDESYERELLMEAQDGHNDISATR